MRNKLVFAVLILITTSLMGSSFAIGKIGLLYISPLLLVGMRFTLAGAVMAIAVKLLKRPHPAQSAGWLHILIIGFFQTAAVMGCIFLSLRTISAGESAILTFTNPLLVVLFGAVFLNMRFRFVQWTGVTMGFIGVFITLGGQLQMGVGTVLGICSAVAWATATLLVKRWGHALDTWVLTAYQMFFGGLLLLIASPLLEVPRFSVTAMSISIVLWLAIMASIVQFAVWFYLLQKGHPGKVSAFLFLAPFFGVLSGWLLLDEQLGLSLLIGGTLIFTGIFLVNWPGKKHLQ